MVMPLGALLWLGTFAALAGFLGLFKRFDDNWTPVLLTFLSAFAWGWFGVSSGDVLVRDTPFASASEPIQPLFYMGLGLAFITALFGIWQFFKAIGSDAESVDADPMNL